jgi:hypothetical protein
MYVSREYVNRIDSSWARHAMTDLMYLRIRGVWPQRKIIIDHNKKKNKKKEIKKKKEARRKTD